MFLNFLLFSLTYSCTEDCLSFVPWVDVPAADWSTSVSADYPLGFRNFTSPVPCFSAADNAAFGHLYAVEFMSESSTLFRAQAMLKMEDDTWTCWQQSPLGGVKQLRFCFSVDHPISFVAYPMDTTTTMQIYSIRITTSPTTLSADDAKKWCSHRADSDYDRKYPSQLREGDPESPPYDDHTPPPSTSSSSSSNSKAIEAGLIAGGVFLLFIILLISFYIYYDRKHPHQAQFISIKDDIDVSQSDGDHITIHEDGTSPPLSEDHPNGQEVELMALDSVGDALNEKKHVQAPPTQLPPRPPPRVEAIATKTVLT